MGLITLWEGNYGKQDIVCIMTVPNDTLRRVYQMDDDRWRCENDEARSLSFQNTKAGVKFWVYGHPDCVDFEATTRIEVKRDITEEVIIDCEAI